MKNPFLQAYCDMFKNLFRPKIIGPQQVRLGKAVVVITTVYGDVYEVPIKGKLDRFDSDYAHCRLDVKQVYYWHYLSCKTPFIEVSGTMAIPLCNIKKMELTKIDEDYSEMIEIKE